MKNKLHVILSGKRMKLFLIISFTIILSLLSLYLFFPIGRSWLTVLVSGRWEYRGDLHAKIASADRAIVRKGGLGDRDFTLIEFKILKEIIRPDEILCEIRDSGNLKELSKSMQLRKWNCGPMDSCLCLGKYTIKWFKGGELLAEVGIATGRLKYRKWPGDGGLDSYNILMDFFCSKGFYDLKTDYLFDCDKLDKEAKRKIADQVLSNLVSEELKFSSPERLSDENIAGLRAKLIAKYGSEDRMLVKLLKILGCLEMRWDKIIPEWQMLSMELVRNTSMEVLDKTITEALKSKDKTFKEGVFRIIYTWPRKDISSEASRYLDKWVNDSMFQAFGTELHENQKLVILSLEKLTGKVDLELLDFAATTSGLDKETREKILLLIERHETPEAKRILENLKKEYSKNMDEGGVEYNDFSELAEPIEKLK